ncbi:hypothetical protein ABVF61_31430 [Roseibium sp. HPY-6]|uniref:hypothetical protein n=1 Tax=Roseibium sp. HPY-6 TaxID=3229852 RepID=UPI00338F01BE
MDYLANIIQQQRQAVRPANYEDLLFHPIADDPTTSGASCYSNWEFDHGTQPRFYVGGVLWFMRSTSLNANSLAGYKEEAVQAVSDRTNWSDMPNSNNNWTGQIARQQFNAARNHKPLFFQKAAVIIMACELAAEKMLASGRTLQDINAAEDIYRFMSIIPACWNINDFDADFYNQHIAKDKAAQETLRRASKQSQKTVIAELANGHTVTYETARAIKSSIDDDLPDNVNVGDVRARPGKQKLGHKRTSDYEVCDCG